MLIKKVAELKASEITDKTLYLERRRFLRVASTTALAVATAEVAPGLWASDVTAQTEGKLTEVRKSPLSTEETLTPLRSMEK